MTNLDSTTNSSEPMSLAARIGWGALIVVTLAVCYFGNLGAIGFVGPDEPRYAWIARDMAETGDWVTPRLYGKPWFEKPVLYYWMAGASFKLFGVSEAAARLPSAISALLATLALAWLAWRVYGAETARWLLLLLPTSVGMIGFSHAAATDMPFSAMLTMAMVCAAVAVGLARNEHTPILPQTPWIALLLFGFFLGLAVLAKGPAAIVLCGGAVFLWALFTKRWRDAFRLLHPAAIVSFCVIALPWYILCVRRNPDFFRVFIIEHNFKRYLTPEFQHIQPFWYYLPVVLIAFLPWTAALIWAAFIGIRRFYLERTVSPVSGFLLSWAMFCLIFFSISRSKLPGYVVPALPAIALLWTGHLVASLRGKHSLLRWIGLGTSGAFLLIGILMYRLNLNVPADVAFKPIPVYVAAAWIAVAGGVFVCVLSLWKPSKLALSVGVVTVLALLTAGTKDLWKVDRNISAREAATSLEGCWRKEKINAAKTYKLRRDYVYSLNFYLHRELSEWSPADGRDLPVFANHRSAIELRQQGFACGEYLDYAIFPAVIVCSGKEERGLQARMSDKNPVSEQAAW
jgi:4-amino-4-deoxy-L-arabinose transferase-like glycosyltransferase